MFFVSTDCASDSSWGSMLVGTSVLTDLLSAPTSPVRLARTACGFIWSLSETMTRCCRCPRSKSFDPCRERANTRALVPSMCCGPAGM